MSIYNNSDEIAYLDSLCIGTVNPVTSTSPSNFTKPDGSLWDEIPLFMMAWQFPGTGTDYPLQPGEETIIALNAINHVDIASQSVDLSKVGFAFWDPLLTGASVPAPGVEPLKMIWRNSGNAFTISLTGPAMVIFKIPTSEAISAQAYAEDPGNIQQDPVKPSATMKFLMIHKDWVIDGVECVTSASKANKRIPNNIDAGFTYIPTSYLGNSVCRKVDEVVDGRTIYMDSNNSSEDFRSSFRILKKQIDELYLKMKIMKFKKIYTLGLGLLIAGCRPINAQTQDNEKIFYRMDRVKANNPWTKSLNYAGLTFNENQDFTIVEIDFQYGKGSFRNVNAPTASNKTNLQTEFLPKIE